MEAEFLEGRHALAEALDAGAPLSALYVSSAACEDRKVAALIARAERDGVEVKTVPNRELDSRSSHGAHQGVIARVKPYRYAELSELISAAEGRKDALIVATDHITDTGNFGAILRSAEVVGACGALVPNKRNARVTAAVYKTSAGAVSHLPIAMEANLVRSLERLKEEGFWIIGASEHSNTVLWDAPLSGRIVIVMGSEGEGLSRLTRETCDLLVALPQAGKVSSLNVAQATTAIAYEWMRQCRAAES